MLVKPKYLTFGFFIFSLGFLTWIFRGDYGFADDYVAVGLAQISGNHFSSILVQNLQSEYSAGRYLQLFVSAIAFAKVQMIEDLFFLRMLSVVALLSSQYFIYFVCRRFFFSSARSFLVSLSVFLAPGGLFLTVLAYGFSFNIFLLPALLLSLHILQAKTKDLKYVVHVVIGAICISFIYQPLLNALILFPTLAILSQLEKKIEISIEAVKSFVVATFAIYSALSVNWLTVHIFYDATRIKGNVIIKEKINLLFDKVLPMVMTPQIFLFNRENSRLFCFLLASLLVLLALFNIFSKLKLRNQLSKKRTYLYVFTFFAQIGSLPITLLWLLLIPEGAVDFRRLYPASIVFLCTILVLLSKLKEREFTVRHIKNGTLAAYSILVVVVLVVVVTALSIKLTTLNPAVQEWNAARCASNKIQLGPSDQIPEYGRQRIEFKGHVRFLSFNDEFAVLSRQFPGPRIFIPMLANNERYSDARLLTPWSLYVNDEFSGTPNGDSWRSAFESCLSKY